jgi:acetyltransferase-like isoleucine patch superfamily enzyme
MGDAESFDVRTVTGEWDYGTLPSNVVLGRDCWIERPQVFERFRSERRPGAILGDRVRAYGWTVFNVEASGCVEVGADCVLVGAVFMCAERIRLGAGVVVSYGVTIADSDFHPRDPEARRRDAEANAPAADPAARPALETSPVEIGDGAFVGIGAIVLKGVTIGPHARVAAGAVVARDVPAGALAEGNPARATPGE